MNYTIYVGNSSENTTIEIANASGVANGTYHDLHYLATNNTQTYYWRVYVNDGILFTNETFSFSLTSGAGGMISMGNSFALVLALGGWIFGIGGILLAVFILTSKKGKRRKK
jgi:type IV secretory pathway VirB6-like protein